MRSSLRSAFFLPLLAVILALALTGCGNNDTATTGAIQPQTPALTVPDDPVLAKDSAANGGSTDSTTSVVTQTSVNSSGGVAPNQTDSPAADTAPAADSPAGKYEQFCKDNPGSCGN